MTRSAGLRDWFSTSDCATSTTACSTTRIVTLIQTSISDLEIRFRNELRMEVRNSPRTVLSEVCGHQIRITLHPESVLLTTCLVTARPASVPDMVWLTRGILGTSHLT